MTSFPATSGLGGDSIPETGSRRFSMQIDLSFPGGARVDAHFKGFTVATDQSRAGGGDESAPEPFSLFMVSIATCAGIYVLRFCQQRGLSTRGLRMRQRSIFDPARGMIGRIELEIELPPGFPERYRPAVIRAAELCAVKKHLEQPPAFSITAEIAQPIPG
jgi:ribosomal protein S12 methylthiotransferase accessory factor